MIDNIYKMLGVDPENLKELNTEQKSMLKRRFTENLNVREVFYGKQDGKMALVFESPNTYKNWQYYAGLEYCGDEDLSCFQHYDGTYIRVLSGHDRIDDIVVRLMDMENEKEDEDDE